MKNDFIISGYCLNSLKMISAHGSIFTLYCSQVDGRHLFDNIEDAEEYAKALADDFSDYTGLTFYKVEPEFDIVVSTKL